MPLWEWVADGVGAVLLLLVLYALALVFRRRWISRDGGTFEVSHRVLTDASGSNARGWDRGLGRYSADLHELFRIFSLPPPPRRWLSRGQFRSDQKREPVRCEEHAL